MAKKRTSELCVLMTPEAVNEALRGMGDYDRRIESLTGEMELKLNQIREEYEMQIRPLQDARKGLETQVLLWAEAHADQFKGKSPRRSSLMTYGEVGYRQSTSVSCPTAPDSVAAVVARLRERNMTDCIKTTPEGINKAALRTYDAETVAAVGCKLVVKDKPYCEPARDPLPEI